MSSAATSDDVDELKEGYVEGKISKDEFGEALRSSGLSESCRCNKESTKGGSRTKHRISQYKAPKHGVEIRLITYA